MMQPALWLALRRKSALEKYIQQHFSMAAAAMKAFGLAHGYSGYYRISKPEEALVRLLPCYSIISSFCRLAGGCITQEDTRRHRVFVTVLFTCNGLFPKSKQANYY